jgi:2-polyprenyl-3-methyl-5-hydroxy-6-metoxy-1,4-benzoquinol methylase
MENIAPKFHRLLGDLLPKMGMRKNSLQGYLDTCDEVFWQRAEDALGRYDALIAHRGLAYSDLIDGYLEMCNDMLKEQIKFARTGRYSAASSADVKGDVYHSEEKMQAYMYGVALSQFLWPQHYHLYSFFFHILEKLLAEGKVPESYLEVGPGHGLFLTSAMEIIPESSFSAVDISPVSIGLSTELTGLTRPDIECNFLITDVGDMPAANVDFLFMGEVLEHVDDPLAILAKIRNVLRPGGSAVITTCANCPAIDHVYLYENADHIRAHIEMSGFDIVEEAILDVDSLPKSPKTKGKISISYAAHIKPLSEQ